MINSSKLPGLPETPEELLSTMISFNTVSAPISGDARAEAALGEYLEQLARASSFETRRLPVEGYADNLLILQEIAPDLPWILFVSHMDTVSIENMSIEPLNARISDGKIFGRGSCDTKGSGAAMFWALTQYARENSAASDPKRPNNIALLFTVNEEAGMTGIVSFVKSSLSVLGFHPLGAIVGEPTNLAPIGAHNGTLRFTIRTTGVAAHSCNPAEGHSAISDMVEIIRHFESLYIPSLGRSHPMTGKAQCSINVIHGGTQANVIPEHCVIQVDRRLIPGEGTDEVLAEIENEVIEIRRRVPRLEAAISFLYATLPLDPAGNSDFCEIVRRTMHRLGFDSELRGVAYGTEAGWLAHGGIPALVLGPGDIAQAHTKDEWLLLDELHRAIDLYKGLMQAVYQ